MNSSHKVEVVPIELTKHPNADRLSVAQVHGYSCVTETTQWDNTPLAAYIPPDSLVPVAHPLFAFLAKDARVDGFARIKAKKLRGVLSFGLLVPAPEGSAQGDDVAESLGVTHYDPDVHRMNGRGSRSGLITSGEVTTPPDVLHVRYDVEAGRRYAKHVFEPSEIVHVTEKIHGCNARYVYHNDQMYCGSRGEWKREYPSYDHVTVENVFNGLRERGLAAKTSAMDLGALMTQSETTDLDALRTQAETIVTKVKSQKPAKNLWWKVLETAPSIEAFCRANPGVVLYGEVYGQVQDLTYDHAGGQYSFACFDVMRGGNFLNVLEARELAANVPWVPVVESQMPFDFNRLCELAEGQSLIAKNIREGVVVRPMVERWNHAVGRVCLKFVSCQYLERSK